MNRLYSQTEELVEEAVKWKNLFSPLLLFKIRKNMTLSMYHIF